MYPIWFILGPSGVGKTTLVHEIAKKGGWLCYELDQLSRQDRKDGIDAECLRNEWQTYLNTCSSSPLIQTVLTRMTDQGKQGVILSFPSILVLQGAHLLVLQSKIHAVYLYGTEEQCLDAFLERERSKPRGLSARTWRKCNSRMFKFLNSEESSKYKVSVFEDDNRNARRRSNEAIQSEILGKPF